MTEIGNNGDRPDEEMISAAINKIRSLGGSRVRFIILYGSAASGKMRKGSDIDICVHFEGSEEEASDFRLDLLSDLDEIYDVKIFDQLPLYIRVDALKGRVLYSDDRSFMCDKAYETIKEWDRFKHRFYDYIGVESIK